MKHPVVVVSFASGVWKADADEGAVGEAFVERFPALEWAHRWAQSNRPSLVRVFDENGAVEDEWAYGAFGGRRFPPSGPRPAAVR